MAKTKWQVQISPETFDAPGLIHVADDGDAIYIPARIHARVVGLAFDVSFVLQIPGVVDVHVATPRSVEPELVELTVRQRRGGPPPGAALFRALAIAGAEQQAVLKASSTLVATEDESGRTLWSRTYSGPASERVKAATQRHRVTDDDLRDAARAYRDSKGQPGDRLILVAEACNISRATAARRVRRAKGLGILEEEDGHR
jgi:hypothetical protein